MKLPLPKIDLYGWDYHNFRECRASARACRQSMTFIKNPADRRRVSFLARAWADMARDARKGAEK